jgi:hypothetical protein
MTIWNIGKGNRWGRSIHLSDPLRIEEPFDLHATHRIHGHLSAPRIQDGDQVRQEMESGRHIRGVVEDVNYMRDPPDQFFATVRWDGYESEESG